MVLTARAGLRLNEIMAANAGFLRDEDGESPDWIELFNPGAKAVNLEGWHLTDDPAELTRWTFPAIELEPGGYLVVFASGKDRVAPSGPLHTNFQLAESGEYLALVRPDGVTVEQAFDPAYPALRPNISFGTEQQAEHRLLIGPEANARYLTPADGGLDGIWQRPDFDDNGWQEGTLPMGYDDPEGEGDPNLETAALQIDFNDADASGETGTADTEAGFIPLTLDNLPATIQGVTLELEAVGGAFLDDRDRDTPREAPPAFTQDQLYDDFIFANGTFDGTGIRLRLSGLAPRTDYELTIWSFDTGSRGTRQSDWFEITDGVERPLITGYTFDGARPPVADGDATFAFTLQSSADGVIAIEGRRRGGQSHGVFLNALRLRPRGFGGMLRTDLAGELRGRPGSLYVRIPFVVDDPTALDALLLKLRYDDGLAVWLNGGRLAGENAPMPLAWNSTALQERLDTEALWPVMIRVDHPADHLRVGRNVVAIQVLNTGPDDGDLLLGLELEGLRETAAVPRFFQPATPGGPNGTGYAGLVAAPRFTVTRGFMDNPFAVAITTDTPGAEIRWTTNGAPPTITTGHLYTGPIPIDQTTVLRAAAFLPDYLPSQVSTHTYLFLDQVLRQPNQLPGYPSLWQAAYPADYEMDPNVVHHARYGPLLKDALRAIPTLSLVAAHQDLWDPTQGIYVDATRSGRAWERPASIELIDTDGKTLFHIDAGVRMQGHASRDNVRTAKHSFRLVFRGDYGSGKLRYRWFPDSPVDAFDNIVLRACFTDAWTTRYSPTTPLGERYRPEDSIYLRDIWMKDSQLAMGWHSAHNTFVHLYLNGLYWGLYNVCERLDASHFAQYFGGREEDWDVIRDFNELLDGRREDWDALMALVNRGISSEADYQAIRQLVDIPNLIDYMILHIYAEAEDWPHHNWYAAHRRASADLPATKWIFLVWDQEIVLDQLYRRNRVNVDHANSPALLYARLRQWPEFRREFADRLQKHLFHDGALTPSNAIARLESRAAQIRQAILAESARWGDAREFPIPPNPGTGETFTRDEWWEPELQKLYTNWFPGQVSVTLDRFRAIGLYPETAPPQFEPYGGPVPEGFHLRMTHTNRTGTILYTLNGPDPRIYGTGRPAPEAQVYREPIPLTGPTRLRARVLNGSEWSPLVEATFYPPRDLSRLVLTEIHYHPSATDPAGEETEFIELYNDMEEPLDLSGLQFTEGIRFTFPEGIQLAPLAHGVLVRNPAAFSSRYPEAPILGMYEGALNNGGETLTLATPAGQPIWSVTYDDEPPWPTGADGEGLSLQRRSAAPGLPGPTAWLAAPPTPGQPLGGADADQDGLPDAWEIAHGLDPNDPADAALDPDADGLTNRQEYEADTDPADASSRLRLRWERAGATAWILIFHAQEAVTYTLQSRDRLEAGSWSSLREYPPGTGPGEVRFLLPTHAGRSGFYRLRARRP